ncbi:GAF and ANTAR domain-containing protein [Amycolatopsis sp. K13G38]|uniref:GAF and ANTAR domain-containing protein n=1 Tax=Amycolatopsis acididurans TaxID=2724524 RepID=A0ABX1J1D4_9PSEU|nr:GAF and ANTAR domain-containing protein [Amycolatopsis acididurans]NKQ53582.1 GAF and ANTAR domain-containing protein [Amycolatopsis acididurans]
MTEQTESDNVALAAALSSVVRTLEPEPDVDKTVGHIVVAASTTVTGTDHAGVSLLEGGVMHSIAPTSDIVAKLDSLQHELGEGPCVDAVFEQPVYRVPDIASETRWPKFASAAVDLGVSSLLGIRLFTTSTTLGALNLYSTRPHAFDEDAQSLADLFAAHAAVALAGARRQAQLRNALRTRDTISMAKGILMERHSIADEQAFSLLVQASQHTNRKLHDVATWLVGEANEGNGKR